MTNQTDGVFDNKSYQNCPSRTKYSITKNYDYYEDFSSKETDFTLNEESLKDWCNHGLLRRMIVVMYIFQEIQQVLCQKQKMI